MAPLAQSKDKDAKGFRRPFQRGGTWGSVEYSVVLGALITIVATVWIAQNFEQVWTIWRAEQTAEELVDDGISNLGWKDHTVQITRLESAVELGAVCLDGSPPAYYLDRGSGKGADKWIVHLEGGGWCRTAAECLDRAFTQLGSSRYMPDEIYLGGMMSSNPAVNPDFYNWNRVKFKYCDGGSFFGEVNEALTMTQSMANHHSERTATVYYRGMRVWNAVMTDLLAKGMENATKGFLAGCSAGGLASTLQCDNFKNVMPEKATVKCLSDAGFFVHMPDIKGQDSIESLYRDVVTLQNITERLPESCTSVRDPSLCIFPTYRLSTITTPFFMLNPAYDNWQFYNVLIPSSADPSFDWESCKSNLALCTEGQMELVQGFRDVLLNQLKDLITNPKDGAFINSCYTHCQSEQDWSWSGADGPKINGKSISQVVGEWFNDDTAHIVVDCAYPCNPTCH
ncbi:O-palmitoleoyl-L-serine hydrolase [Marchantia polymorpha subsp. ruderalis]|uniref:Pectin acetylesterase n=2 Tax=Marchantia polymorpha TaxID=3197 RepID=A0AAF6BL95_MARPO|nr:hypothetical protein MARPO_0010s0172 [Marchantia polymorpha]BBN12779.1 hypothetical protein Mp_5g22840 [Marchantia polymorpha subsp. ruderalis]|eukprot:PTQ46800.1 hypothetical protein MARPO_0010s0172 [Marchantia polymorpha]